MFSVLFEVNPKRDEWDAYLGYARLLRPELERIEGFVDNIRYRSLTREGWLLSLSSWDDEKSLVRWRTLARHHEVQVKGRTEVFADYHLRVGQLTEDTRLPAGRVLAEQRLDETEAGAGTAVTLVDSARPEEWVTANAPERLAAWLGLPRAAAGLLTWDVFDAVLSPGQIVLLVAWRDRESALAFGGAAPPAGGRAAAAGPGHPRLRHVRPPRGAAVLPGYPACMKGAPAPSLPPPACGWSPTLENPLP